MNLGAFSISLDVADIERSRAFYEALGFAKIGGEAGQGWLILRNGAAVIGLFKGMIERNTLTFNPGWTAEEQAAEDAFDDVRAIQAMLKARGLTLEHETEADGTGPAHITLTDPDGNPVLIDQHVPRPRG